MPNVSKLTISRPILNSVIKFVKSPLFAFIFNFLNFSKIREMFEISEFLQKVNSDNTSSISGMISFKYFLDNFFSLSDCIFNRFPNLISSFQKHLSLNQLFALLHVNHQNSFQKNNLIKVLYSVFLKHFDEFDEDIIFNLLRDVILPDLLHFQDFFIKKEKHFQSFSSNNPKLLNFWIMRFNYLNYLLNTDDDYQYKGIFISLYTLLKKLFCSLSFKNILNQKILFENLYHAVSEIYYFFEENKFDNFKRDIEACSEFINSINYFFSEAKQSRIELLGFQNHLMKIMQILDNITTKNNSYLPIYLKNDLIVNYYTKKEKSTCISVSYHSIVSDQSENLEDPLFHFKLILEQLFISELSNGFCFSDLICNYCENPSQNLISFILSDIFNLEDNLSKEIFKNALSEIQYFFFDNKTMSLDLLTANFLYILESSLRNGNVDQDYGTDGSPFNYLKSHTKIKNPFLVLLESPLCLFEVNEISTNITSFQTYYLNQNKSSINSDIQKLSELLMPKEILECSLSLENFLRKSNYSLALEINSKNIFIFVAMLQSLKQISFSEKDLLGKKLEPTYLKLIIEQIFIIICSHPTNCIYIYIGLEILIELLRLNKQIVSEIILNLFQSQKNFLNFFPLLNFYFKNDFLTDDPFSSLSNNSSNNKWLNSNLSPIEQIWRVSLQITFPKILHSVLKVIQKLCQDINFNFQNLFRHQNILNLTNSERFYRTEEEFNPNNIYSIEFISKFIDFLFQSTIKFAKKIKGNT